MKEVKFMYSEEMIKDMIIKEIKAMFGIEIKKGDIIKTEFGNWEVRF